MCHISKFSPAAPSDQYPDAGVLGPGLLGPVRRGFRDPGDEGGVGRGTHVDLPPPLR